MQPIFKKAILLKSRLQTDQDDFVPMWPTPGLKVKFPSDRIEPTNDYPDCSKSYVTIPFFPAVGRKGAGVFISSALVDIVAQSPEAPVTSQQNLRNTLESQEARAAVPKKQHSTDDHAAEASEGRPGLGRESHKSAEGSADEGSVDEGSVDDRSVDDSSVYDGSTGLDKQGRTQEQNDAHGLMMVLGMFDERTSTHKKSNNGRGAQYDKLATPGNEGEEELEDKQATKETRPQEPASRKIDINETYDDSENESGQGGGDQGFRDDFGAPDDEGSILVHEPPHRNNLYFSNADDSNVDGGVYDDDAEYDETDVWKEIPLRLLGGMMKHWWLPSRSPTASSLRADTQRARMMMRMKKRMRMRMKMRMGTRTVMNRMELGM